MKDGSKTPRVLMSIVLYCLLLSLCSTVLIISLRWRPQFSYPVRIISWAILVLFSTGFVALVASAGLIFIRPFARGLRWILGCIVVIVLLFLALYMIHP